MDRHEWVAGLAVGLTSEGWRSFLFISLFPHLTGEFYWPNSQWRGVGGQKNLCAASVRLLSVEHKAGTMTRARDVVKGNLAHIVKGVCFNLASFVFGPCSSQPLVFTGPSAYRPYVKTISLVHG